jgi:hypothetical protein
MVAQPAANLRSLQNMTLRVSKTISQCSPAKLSHNQRSVLEVTHACGDQRHAILVAAVNRVLVPDAASGVCDCCNAGLQASRE